MNQRRLAGDRSATLFAFQAIEQLNSRVVEHALALICYSLPASSYSLLVCFMEFVGMKNVLRFAVLFSLVVAFSVVATAQVKKGKTRLLTTKQFMGGLIKPQSGGLGEGLKTAPADDKAWAELATKAALLNEASYTMMDDDRCPDEVWAKAAKTLGDGTAALIQKIEAKDLAGAQDAFKTASSSCGTCHKAHKK